MIRPPSRNRQPEEGDEIGRLNRLLVIVYLVEVGLVLIVAPWTRFWDRNYFVEAWPVFETALTSSVVRGSVSGFGLVSLGAALLEILELVRDRWLGGPPAGGHAARVPPVDAPSQDLREEVYPPSS